MGAGVVAGVFWSKTSSSRDAYSTTLDDFEAAQGDIALQQELYDDLKQQRTDTEKNNNIAVGMTVGAGVLAAATAVVWIVYAQRREDVSAAGDETVVVGPGTIGVAF